MSGKYCHWGGCCRRRPQTSLPFSPPSSLSRGHASSLPCRARPSVECCVLACRRFCAAAGCAPPLASPRFFPFAPFCPRPPFLYPFVPLFPFLFPFVPFLFPFFPFFPSPLLFSSPFCPFSTLFPFVPFLPFSLLSLFFPCPFSSLFPFHFTHSTQCTPLGPPHPVHSTQ